MWPGADKYRLTESALRRSTSNWRIKTTTLSHHLTEWTVSSALVHPISGPLRMWPGAAGSARSALRRWPDAIAIKKKPSWSSRLLAKPLQEAWRGPSRGPPIRREGSTWGETSVQVGVLKRNAHPTSQRRCCRNTWTVRKTSMNGRDRRSISAYLRKPSDPYQKGSSENGHVRQRCRTGIHPLRFAPTEKSCKTGMYASRVESRRLRATTAAAFQKSLPELRPPWQGPSSQVEGGRPWVQGPRYRLGYHVPANGEGSRIPHY